MWCSPPSYPVHILSNHSCPEWSFCTNSCKKKKHVCESGVKCAFVPSINHGIVRFGSLQEGSSFFFLYDQPPCRPPHQPAVSHGTKQIRMMQTDSTRHTIDYWIYIHHRVCVSVRPFGALLDSPASDQCVCKGIEISEQFVIWLRIRDSFSLNKKRFITANVADGFEARLRPSLVRADSQRCRFSKCFQTSNEAFTLTLWNTQTGVREPDALMAGLLSPRTGWVKEFQSVP